MKKHQKKGAISAVLAFTMACSVPAAPAFGAEEGKMCDHVHSDSCMERVLDCHHVHDDSCYTEDLTATDSNALILDCHHEHDDSCYTEVCSHVHDENCVFEDDGEKEKPDGDETPDQTEPADPADKAEQKDKTEQEKKKLMAADLYELKENANYSYDTATKTLTIKTDSGTNSWKSVVSNNVSEVEHIVIGSSVTQIKPRAFSDCTGVLDVTFESPSSLDWIGSSAFENTGSLKELVIPNSVKIIDTYAFQNSGIESITLPDSLDMIATSLFRECENLTEITLPDTVKEIRSSAFYSCKSLKEIVLPEKVTAIESYAFWGCSGLEKVGLTNNVASIGNAAFTGCLALKEITLPDGITNIQADTFHGCSSLESIVIPDKVNTILESAFEGCEKLKNIQFGINVGSIRKCAFKGCKSLESITLPSLVNFLGSSSFEGCDQLKTVNIKSLQPPTLEDGNVFPAAKDSGFKINVPAGSISWYKEEWARYKDFFDAADDNTPTPPTPDHTGGGSSSSSDYEIITYKDSLPVHYKGDTKIIRNMRVPSYVIEGTWQEEGDGRWKLKTADGQYAANTWVPAFNPYADITTGQLAFDWFMFDADGYLMTGWYTDADGSTYYLNPNTDNTKGRMMTGWCQIDGDYYYFHAEPDGTRGAMYRNTTTPGGYQVDANGRWIS